MQPLTSGYNHNWDVCVYSGKTSTQWHGGLERPNYFLTVEGLSRIAFKTSVQEPWAAHVYHINSKALCSLQRNAAAVAECALLS